MKMRWLALVLTLFACNACVHESATWEKTDQLS